MAKKQTKAEIEAEIAALEAELGAEEEVTDETPILPAEPEPEAVSASESEPVAEVPAPPAPEVVAVADPPVAAPAPAPVPYLILLEDGERAPVESGQYNAWRVRSATGIYYEHCRESPDGEWIYRVAL